MTNEDKTLLFDRLKTLLQPVLSQLKSQSGKPGEYHLTGEKEVILDTKKIEGMYFASVIIQKNHVGFYFFPIYTDTRHFEGIDPLLRKCLKGKSCFHITKNNDRIFEAVETLLKKGLKLYRQKGWI